MTTWRPLVALIISAAACQRKAAPPSPPAATLVFATDTVFKTPESVKYDPDLDLYFVTNINGNPSAKDGNGFISRMTPEGRVDPVPLAAGGRDGVTLNGPKGTAIVGDTLWVADIDAVRGFNKRTGKPVASVDLSRLGAKFLNDLAVGPDGALYVTDTGILIDAKFTITHPGPDRIFRIGPKRDVSVAAEGDTLQRPNGITWDAANARFIVVAYGGPAVFSWKPGERGGAPTVLANGQGQWDGVEIGADGRIIVSSWADSSVNAVADGKFERLIGGVPSPADIGLDTKRNRILIPVFLQNRVQVWQLPQRGTR